MKSLHFVRVFAVFMFAGVMIARPAGASAQFAKTLRYDSGGLAAESVAIADVNGDGKLDLVVANFDQNGQRASGGVSVFLGNGDGTFQPAVSYSSGGWGGSSLAIADVNGDGKPDVVVTNWCLSISNCAFGGGDSEGGVSVLLGNGDGTFQAAVGYDTGADSARSVAVGDFNGDGNLDLVAANQCQSVGQYNQCISAGGVSILLGNGDGTFQAAVVYSSGADYADSVAVSDLNGDGHLDVVVINSCCSESGVGVLLGNGDGTFQPAAAYALPNPGAKGIAIGDLNGDGIPDLVVTDWEESTVSVLLGNGDGRFQAAVEYNSGASELDSVAIADMNGDGIPDLVVGGNGVLGVYVMLGRGDGSFDVGSGYHAGGEYVDSVAVADLNGDGKPDVVAADYQAKFQQQRQADGEVGVLLNTFVATTATHVTSSLDPSQVNQSVTFTAAVVSKASSVPNGSVITFYSGAGEIGTGATTNGVATMTTSFSTSGKYTIEASYPGDVFHEASSGKVKQVVKP